VSLAGTAVNDYVASVGFLCVDCGAFDRVGPEPRISSWRRLSGFAAAMRAVALGDQRAPRHHFGVTGCST